MTFACKTFGKIFVSDEADNASRYGISGAEWGIWNVVSGVPEELSPVLLYWSKWDTPFVAASQCQMSKIYIPSGRVVIEGGDPKKNSQPRTFSVGSSVCELYTHATKSGRVIGVTVLPVASNLWNRPDSPLLELWPEPGVAPD
jgi:hypothetical protein